MPIKIKNKKSKKNSIKIRMKKTVLEYYFNTKKEKKKLKTIIVIIKDLSCHQKESSQKMIIMWIIKKLL